MDLMTRAPPSLPGTTSKGSLRRKFNNYFGLALDGNSRWGKRRALATSSTNGYNLVSWHDSGTAYWAISDVNLEDLSRFANFSRANSSRTCKMFNPFYTTKPSGE